jgi:GlpG protein
MLRNPFWTFFLLIACCLLFFIDVGSSLVAPATFSSVTAFSPIKKHLLFDYPKAMELEDTLIEKDARGALTRADEPKIQEAENASIWGGVSLTLFSYITGVPISPHPSLSLHFFCEKIHQGEVWRLFTPALLHGSLLHLLFNITWLYILGKQIELHIGGCRYVFFILVPGIITNAAQYVMSGFAFLGFSGILFAMASFIATRQRLFPEEGFFIEKSLYTFLKGTVWFFAALSLIIFAIECYVKHPIFSLGLANAAHITGLLSGICLGRCHLFSPKSG